MARITGILLIGYLFISQISFAQNLERSEDLDGKGIQKTSETTLQIELHTDGYGLSCIRSYNINRKKSTFIQYSVNNRSISKEKKLNSIYPADQNGYQPKRYIFGKRNAFYNFHLNFGRRNRIGEKAYKSGIEIVYMQSIGVILGVTKAYSLNLITHIEPDPNTNGLKIEYASQTYGPETAAAFANPEQIFGYSGFGKGLGKLGLHPGLNLKYGLRFDWASSDKMIKAIEASFDASIYLRKVPIMINHDFNKFLFLSVNAALVFGKKK